MLVEVLVVDVGMLVVAVVVHVVAILLLVKLVVDTNCGGCGLVMWRAGFADTRGAVFADTTEVIATRVCQCRRGAGAQYRGC